MLYRITFIIFLFLNIFYEGTILIIILITQFNWTYKTPHPPPLSNLL